eukprot:scaffold244569_cov61-Attheya_sp.AAC.1
MERSTRLALVLHAVAELITGTLLMTQPHLFAADNASSVDHAEAMRGIGNGALSILFVGLAMLLSHDRHRPRWAYAIMAQYHLGVCILQIKHPLPGVPLMGAIAFHGPLLACFGWRAVQTPPQVVLSNR